jgi:signal transduction histidine kinase
MTTEKKQLLDKTFQTFMDAGLGGENLDLLDEIVASDVVGIGTAIDEKLFGVKEFQDLLIRQKEQSAGMEMHWKINTLDVHISADENTAIYTNDLNLYITVDANTIEMYMRFSVVLEYAQDKWWVVHWHGSKPEHVESEKDTWGVQTWKEKAEALEKEVAARTADLVEKNQELQVEAALERVRARSLAMHHTSELQSVIHSVHQELLKLNLSISGGSFIAINSEIDDEIHCWGAGGTAETSDEVHIPRFEKPFYTNLLQGIKKGPGFFTESYTREEKIEFFTFLFGHEPWSKLDEKQKEETLSAPGGYTRSCTVSTHTSIFIINHTGEKFSDDDNDILKRFGKVFEQSYTRFLDLQKAEAQAKEAQIEAALERVRSKTMAMHNSNDVGESVATLFNELTALGLLSSFDRCGIGIMQPNKMMELWTAEKGMGKTELTIGHLNMQLHTLLQNVYQNWLDKKETYQYILQGEDKFKYYEAMRNQANYKIRKDYYSSQERIVHTDFFFKEGCLYVFSQNAFTPEATSIFIRFVNVFGQTYRRYLDLQKAEAQAREAQIEAALERVRSRSMAMHKSEEFPEVVQVVFEQFQQLDFKIDSAQFDVSFRETDDLNLWAAAPWQPYATKLHIPYTDNEVFNSIKKAKKAGEDFVFFQFTKEQKNDFFKYFFLHVPNIPEERKKLILSSPGMVRSAILLDKVSLAIQNYSAIPYSDAEHNILKRFAKAFEQTYTRFLDLQKAEAQAREAQIESALERVRSKAMAMRTSEDIAETTAASFDELKKLGIFSFRSGVGILTKGSTIAHVFADSRSIDGQVQALTTTRNMDEHPALKQQYKAWEQQEDYEQILTGDELKSYYSHAFFQASKINVQEVEYGNQECGYYFAFPDGLFYSWSYQPYTESEKNILRRFRNIIALTFRRFLDLQKAESQTREAQIEAALERIRSRALAMHRSEEFSDVAKVMREQMGYLGQPELETSAVHLYDEDPENIFSWRAFRLSSFLEGNIISGFFKIPKNSCAIAIEFIQKFNSNATEYTIEVSGEKQTEWYKILFKLAPEVEAAMKISGTTNEIRYYHFSKFSGGALLMVSSKEPANDAIELQKRSAQVFDLAYRRFKDLQKAEAQALEATKRASVDRVRAEIASMRTTSDLDRIQPLIWNELKILGVPFIRCGVFIMDEAKQELQAFLSTPDGKSIAAFHLPYQSTEQSKQIVAHWQQKKLFKDHMDEAAFAEYTQNLVQQGAVASDEKYVTENRPTDLYLHFLPFLQGMMYVGNDAPLKDEALQLVQNLADAFSTAYARYEDFNKLEAAKAAVESAMDELKSTQAQLVQQEKLASLGQLTAGIAHEIKNPLNFVNNFSEVSLELIDESLEEMNRGPETRDETILNENLAHIKSNIIKVLDHGTRANSIVNSMLMHSRQGSGHAAPTMLNDFIREYSNLAYHGMRAGNHPLDVQMNFNLDGRVKEVPLIAEDFSRVVLNICNNAFDAMRSTFKPTLTIRTQLQDDSIIIQFEDNGPGIPDDIKDKILQPFFTTKKGTEGTGLGLSISHDIIKAHGGELKVESLKAENQGLERQGSRFTITLHQS